MKSVVHRRLLELEAEPLNPQMTRRMLWGEHLMAAYLEFKKGAIVPVHQHENEQLTYCLSGLMRFTLPDRTLVLRPGEVLLIPGGVSHGAEMPEETGGMDFFRRPRPTLIATADGSVRRGSAQ